MRLKAWDLIERLGAAIVRAKDSDIEVEFDRIMYLHPSANKPHLIELVDVVARQDQQRHVERLERQIQQLTAELESYRRAYG